MSEQVSTFLPVEIGKMSYLFFLVTWNDYVSHVAEELDKQFAPFGEDLGETGKVIKSYKSAARASFGEVMEKSWPDEVGHRFASEQDPFMLVIDKNFNEFDPESDRWGIVWFSNFNDKPESIYRMFGCMAQKVRQGAELFDYLSSVARQEKYKKFGKYFELNKPEFFGISIDVQAIMEDLIGA